MRHSFGLTLAALAIILGSLFASESVHAGGGGHGCREPVTDAHGTRVDIKDLCFITTVLHVQPGDSVTWTNRDAMDHTVTGANGSWGSYSPLPLGKSETHRFDASGVYPYFCELHPGMVGAIVVGDGSGPGAATGDGAAPAGIVLTKSGGAADGSHANGGVATKTSKVGRGTVALAAVVGAAAAAVACAGVTLFARSGRRRTAAEVSSGLRREADAG